jgi:membrane protein YqaA with SNARE-associated domain
MHALPILAGFLLAGNHHEMMKLFLRFGLIGLFLVSTVDSSFVPLPIPGLTDIMLVLYAAQHENPSLLIAIATLGSALGGWFSWRVGQSGGMAFIEKRTPPRIFKRVCGWMESHAILAVALPAILPPPMPLSPFVLAAGALNMSLRKFMIAFTGSRLVRHTVAVLIGIRYGKHFLHLWFKFSDKYGEPILIVIWAGIAVSLGYAFYQLWKTSHTVGATRRDPAKRPTTV